MSFQAYLDNVKKKTGKTRSGLRSRPAQWSNGSRRISVWGRVTPWRS